MMKGILPIFVLCSSASFYVHAKNVPLKTRNEVRGRTHGNFAPEIESIFQTLDSSPKVRTGMKELVSSGATDFFAEKAGVSKDEVEVSSFHTSRHNGVTHVYFQQRVNGIPVANAYGNINILKDGSVHSIGSSFYIGNKPEFMKPKLSASDAVRSLAGLLNMKTPFNLQESTSPFSENKRNVSGVSFAVADVVPAELNYFQVNGGSQLVLVWNIEVNMPDNYYKAYVDAETNQIWALMDFVSDASYNVQRFGLNDPRDGPRQIIRNPENTVASPMGWHTLEFPENNTITVGNNVIAQENHDGGWDYIGNKRPSGGANLFFNFPMDLNKEPRTYVDASTTQVFYMTNVMHDVFYMYGFNEAAGNFQEYNYELGGEGGDSVVANTQDGSGTDNANFLTLPDGVNGMMRMYLFTNSNPSKPMTDAAFDTAILIHEYSHGVSTRLTGGRTNVQCLGDGESGGMGEGWGDIFGVIFQMRSNTKRTAVFDMGSYATGGTGIRYQPYSTNMTINNSTYKFVIAPGYEYVHAKGEVWAVMLYEVYWNLVDKHGFDPNWSNTTGNSSPAGNIIFAQLLIDGMKLQPCTPNFVQARDAIIEADRINNKGVNFVEIWKGFAKRGLGKNARYPGVESFDVPTEEEDKPKDGASANAFSIAIIVFQLFTLYSTSQI